MPEQQAHPRRAIEAALLDFQQAPGRHVVALRQPAVLFASVREVLQIAAGRSVEEDGPPPALPVVQSARFFIRTALLHPNSTHYALLGLAEDADTTAMKERYRLMMRLLHPDFAAGGTAWPADAASRINQAYEVLSSPERRRAYDEELRVPVSPQPPSPQREMTATRPARREAASAPPQDPRQVLRWLATAFGAVGGLALIGFWLASSQERDTLVQRATTRVAPAKVAGGGTAPEPAPVSAPAPEGSFTESIARALPALLRPDEPQAEPASAVERPPPTIAAVLAAPVPAAVAAPVAVPDPVPVKAEAPPAPPAPPPPPPAPPPAVAPAPVVVAQAAPPAPSPAPAIAAPTIADVQLQLTRLLTQVETGWGDNVIGELPDRAARGAPGAQALSRQVDAAFDGVRPVRITRSDFRTETRDGRLLVTGVVVAQVRGNATRSLAILAEFTDRNGVATLTRLAPAPAP